ncbi:MAG TPA: branched-chain amino acid ABC transporter substrate-binding protein [Solirubrobacteraceae bacterium]|nr:branched-chain amino acid ABC transporter substrate-binding protein [Solirubrobacteraceae bacterium]
MRVRSLATLLGAAVACALSVSGCGGKSAAQSSTSTGGTNLTVYSGLPLQGADAGQSESILDGEKLALEQVGGRVGRFTVKLVSKDDSTAQAGQWTPAQTSTVARAAVQDKSTIAYIGDFDSFASAISIPITNEAGIVQISPSNTYVGLTRTPGADKGEPDKYYPSGQRNYGRVIPADDVQAQAQAGYQRAQGCSLVYVVDDRSLYGRSLAQLVLAADRRAGLRVLADEIGPGAPSYADVAQRMKAAGADCLFFGATDAPTGVQLWKDVHDASPRARLFAPHYLAIDAFVSALSHGEENVTYLTTPTLPRRLYPPAGKRFLAQYRQAFGSAAMPYAAYGYTAMRVVLEAIRRAGNRGNDRQAVIDELFKTKDLRSPLGTFSIDRNGDTSLTDYALDRVQHGQVVFTRAVHARPAR